MNNPYDVHSWSTQYRQERLAEAQMTHIEGRLRENRKARSGWGRMSLVWASVLSLLSGAGL
jgi:hypothetical protein